MVIFFSAPAPVTGKTETSEILRGELKAGDVPEKIHNVPEYESCQMQLAMNLSFYRSYGLFARTGGNPYDRTDERTSPKKFATYLKTKVSRLEKLVERSVDPVDAGLTVSARGYGYVRSSVRSYGFPPVRAKKPYDR